MRKGKIFFHPIEGMASLTISWSSGPKGDAIEARRGAGVGFFSDTGDLLCVIFDEVRADHDQQTLEFNRKLVKIIVKNGKVTCDVSELMPKTTTRKRLVRRRRLLKR